MSEHNRTMNPFWLVGNIDEEMTVRFLNYLYNCAADNQDALVIISSDSGNTHCARNIYDTLCATEVRLIAVGFGRLSNIAGAIFCLAEERILAPSAELALTRLDEHLDKFYLRNIGVDEFLEETSQTDYWAISDEECEERGITTRSYANAAKEIVEIYRRNINQKSVRAHCHLYGEMNAKSTADILAHIFKCVAAEKEMFLEINSGGGDINCLAAIVATLEITGVKLTTIGGGMVASCAAALFLMGDRRILKPSTTLMLHEAHREIKKESKWFLCDIPKIYVNLAKANEVLVGCYVKKTALSRYEFNKRTKGGKDWYVESDDYSFTTDTYDIVVKEIIQERKKS